MLTVNIQEIQTKFDELLSSVACGNDVIFTRYGEPVARLSAIAPKPKRQLGFVSGTLPDSFFDPLPEEETRIWGL
jgi:antitoxin (DNA-binding transcriptional repressor) of toxin-antitoxin stability system